MPLLGVEFRAEAVQMLGVMRGLVALASDALAAALIVVETERREESVGGKGGIEL